VSAEQQSQTGSMPSLPPAAQFAAGSAQQHPADLNLDASSPPASPRTDPFAILSPQSTPQQPPRSLGRVPSLGLRLMSPTGAGTDLPSARGVGGGHSRHSSEQASSPLSLLGLETGRHKRSDSIVSTVSSFSTYSGISAAPPGFGRASSMSPGPPMGRQRSMSVESSGLPPVGRQRSMSIES
jgi:hypothetical protein